MRFKEEAQCHLEENEWIEREQHNCEVNYTDREMNRYCHEVIKRELDRRRDICS